MSEHTARTRPWGPVTTLAAITATMKRATGAPRPISPAYFHLTRTGDLVGLCAAVPAASLTLGTHTVAHLADWARAMNVLRVTLNGQAGGLDGFVTVTGWLHSGPVVIVSDLVHDLPMDVPVIGVLELTTSELYGLAAGSVPSLAVVR